MQKLLVSLVVVSSNPAIMLVKMFYKALIVAQPPDLLG
jgi:hypothetical protein